MSNYLAIASVTACLKYLLEGVNEVTSDHVDITTLHPTKLDSVSISHKKNRLNIFLYHITDNPSFRNSTLPNRNSKGELVNIPQIGLGLYYLLTAYPKDDEDSPLIAQRLLASAIRILNENPFLTSEIINKATTTYLTGIPEGPDRSKIISDLADQKDPVKLGFQPLSLDELAKIWTSFFQTNYRVSVAYYATVVLLDSKQSVKSTIPVEDRLLYVSQSKRPIIIRIEPQVVEWAPKIKIGIVGRNLKADFVKVQFDNREPKEVLAANVSDDRIIIEIPDEVLSFGAGRKLVQVIHPLMMGLPAFEHRGFESNIWTFTLSPKITTKSPVEVFKGDVLKLDFQPPVAPKQKIDVLLDDLPALPMIHPSLATGTPVSSVSVKIHDELPEKEFLVRIRIDDDVESLLHTDKDVKSPTYRNFVDPKVKVKSP